jgi:hypothetical protein
VQQFSLVCFSLQICAVIHLYTDVNVISYKRGNLLVDDETLQPEVNCPAKAMKMCALLFSRAYR